MKTRYAPKIWAALVGLILLMSGAIVGYDQLVKGVAVEPEEAAFITLLNNYRAENGLSPVAIDAKLQKAAEARAQDMVDNNYFSHTSSTGEDPFQFACRVADYCYNAYKGENIAAGFTAGSAVFQGWKNSPGHDANMKGIHYTATGIARIQCSNCAYGFYWASLFGSVFSGPLVTPTPVPSVTPTIAPPVPTVTPVLVPCPWDLTGDRVVNGNDLLAFAPVWGQPSNYDVRFDFRPDGAINGSDLLQLAPHWGACPAALGSLAQPAPVTDLPSLFNLYRASLNLPPLGNSPLLAKSAQAAAQLSIDTCSFRLPSRPAGATSWTAFGVYGYGSATQVWNAQQGSPNLQKVANVSYNAVGIGRATGSCNLGVIWIIELGKTADVVAGSPRPTIFHPTAVPGTPRPTRTLVPTPTATAVACP